MTGWALDADDERMRSFEFFLKKPFDFRQAGRIVERAVAMSALRRGDQ
jgi:hypothetical protein